ncbi:phage tail tape measure protein [Escherichia coli]|nr:phage tail tape measure protein [Escherichia coli]
MGAPVMAAVKSYTSMEDAMKGVAKQVNGLRDDNGNRTARFYEMQDAIKAASEQLPMENGAVDFAALVEGGARMNVANPDDSWEDQKRDLLAFASTAAKAATAFELPADELSESLGKIAQLYKIPTRNIEQLGDALNYLDDNAMSKGADIIDVMQRLGGVADRLDYRKAAALGSTFLTLGAAPEVAASAANAMVRELSIATMQSKSFFEGMNLLKLNPEVIEKQMTKDAMGTIQRVLEKVNALPQDKRLSAMTMLFGKEFGDDAAKLANNLPELQRQLKLTAGNDALGSMQKEPAKKESTTVKRKRRTKKQKKEPEAKQGDYLVGTDENVLVLNRTYANRSNAERAAKMQWERLQRGVASFSLQLAEGRADLYTEMPVKVSGFKQPIDDAEWTITTLTHTVSPDNGFTTSLELEVRIDDFEME